MIQSQGRPEFHFLAAKSYKMYTDMPRISEFYGHLAVFKASILLTHKTHNQAIETNRKLHLILQNPSKTQPMHHGKVDFWQLNIEVLKLSKPQFSNIQKLISLKIEI